MHALSCTFLRRSAGLFLCVPLAAVANPFGSTIVAGAATINHQGATTTITQGTDRAVINWNDFNIGAGERTQFLQPGAQSAVLNRVTGGNPTQIFGRLEGNGRVFVLNPNGVLVGAAGVVQTQGFVASTLNVSNSDFMAGGDLRFSGSSTAAVENLGRIDAGQGDAILIAHRVRNAGDIASSGGTAGLAAGTDVLLAKEGDTRIWVKSGVAGAGGTGVDQSGTVNAVQAELKAAGGNVYSLAVNSGGLVSATGVTERDGRIYLTSDGGHVEVSGTLQARGAGGQGGEIYVGGGYQGKDAAVANAGATTVTATAQLDAGGDAEHSGKVVVWSDGATRYAGATSTGRGGEVEVSGKGTLDFTGTVNTHGGHLLLDPTDVTIDNSNFATLIGNPLLTGAVTISATNDITYNTSNPIESNYTLVWDAGRDVIFAPTSAFGSMGAGNNVDFQVYAGRDFVMNAASGIFFSGDGKALIRAGRDITMGGSATISFGSGGWALLSADTNNSTRPAHGDGKITLDTTAYLNAAKIQAFAVSPSQFVNNSAVSFAAPTYNNWEEDINISSAGSGLWFRSNSNGTFGPAITNLLITANSVHRYYGEANPVFTAIYSGLTNGDTPAVVTGLQFSTTATMSSNAGTYTITPFGASAPDYYTLSYAPGTLTIDRTPLLVSMNTASRWYGDPNPEFTVRYTGLVNGDYGPDAVTGLNFSTAANAFTSPGAYRVQLTGGSSQNYELTLESGIMTISPAILTLTIGNTSRVYGNIADVFANASIVGFKNNEKPDRVVDGFLRQTTTATATSGVGQYAINGSGLRTLNNNYTINYVPGVLTVTPAPLLIKANDTTRQQGQDNIFTATYTGLVNGDTAAVVSGLLFNTPATPSSGIGTYTVTPYGATAANYDISYQPGSLLVTDAIQVVTTTTTLSGVSGVPGSWSDTRLLETLNQAQIDGYVLMNAHINQALQRINQSKATVMAESVQYLLMERDEVQSEEADDWGDAPDKAVKRLLLYMQQNYGMGPDTTNYADFVHDLFPTWLPQLEEIARTDAEMRSWLSFLKVESTSSFRQSTAGQNAEQVYADALTRAALRVAYTFRSADEKATMAAAESYLATRRQEMDARMASLEAQIKAQVIAEDPSVPHTRLEQLFNLEKEEDKHEVFFELNTTVAQKWAEYYSLQAESKGYQDMLAGKNLSALSAPEAYGSMVLLLKTLLDQGKIQIY